jgi:hypothetical protein
MGDFYCSAKAMQGFKYYTLLLHYNGNGHIADKNE